MDNRDLENFVALAQTLHFAKAARQVHISPSALTRAIQRLEDETNQVLFMRDRRTVNLTPAGEIFLDYAQQTLAHWERCQARLTSQGNEIGGAISIYGSVTAVYSILSEILRPFRNRYPKVHIQLSTGTVAGAIDKVRDKAADCAVAALPDHLPQGVAFQSLITTSLIFIGPLGFENTPCYHDDGTVDWNHTPVILPEMDVSRKRQEQWFGGQKVKPAVFAEVAGNEAIIAMVSLGFGVGVVPEIVLSQSPLKNKIQILDISPPLPAYSIGVAYLAKRQNEAVINAFRTLAREHFKGLEYGI